MCFALSTASLNADDSLIDPQMIEFLNQEGTVRIFIDASPGYGHQGHALKLMERLREVGYKGKIHVVFDNSDQLVTKQRRALIFESKKVKKVGANADKFNRILESFNPQLDYQELSDGIVFEELKHFEKSSPSSVTLGFSAGVDKVKNIANILNVKTGVVLNHSYWSQSSYVVDELGYFELLPNSVQKLSVKIPEPKSEVPKPLNKLHELVGWMPVYGIDREISSEYYFRAVNAAKPGLLNTFKEGVVIPVFDSNMKSHQALLNSFDIQIISFEEFSSGNYDYKDKITVVEMGIVSSQDFQHYFSRANIAPVVSGKNTMSLMEQKGLPYISAIRQSREISELDYDTYLKDDYHKKLVEITSSIVGGFYKTEDEVAKNIQKVTNFILDSVKTDSELLKLASVKAAERESIQFDKLVQGVKSVMNHVNQSSCSKALGNIRFKLRNFASPALPASN